MSAVQLYIDIDTGEARHAISGSLAKALSFIQGDLATINVAFTRAFANLTAATVTGGVKVRATLRAVPGVGQVLSSVESSTVANGFVSLSLPVSTVAINALLADSQFNLVGAFLDISIVATNGTTRSVMRQLSLIKKTVAGSDTEGVYTQGDDWSFVLDQIFDRDGAAVSSLAGWSARFTIKDADGAIVVERTSAGGHITVSGLSFVWSVPNSITAGIAAGSYSYIVELTDNLARISSPVTGTINVVEDES